jgi:hypothetical protein
MSKSNQSLEEGVTVKTLLLVAVLTMILTFIYNLWELTIVMGGAVLPGPAHCLMAGLTWIYSGPGFITGLPFLALMFLFPFALKSSNIRRRLGADKLTYLYVVTFTTAGAGYSQCIIRYLAFSKASTATISPTWARKIPDFIALPSDMADALIKGPIPWNVWISPILWLFCFEASFGIISIAVANILRKSWIDIERVPFPRALLAYESLVQVQGGERSKPRRRMFLLGLLAGLIIVLPMGMAAYFPWAPDIFGYRSYTCGNGAQQIPPDSPLYSLPIALHLFTKAPIPYAIAYVMPLDVLFSSSLFTLIYIIMVFIAYNMGYYTSLTQIGSCGRLWCTPNSPTTAPPLMTRDIAGGGLLGLTIMTLFFNRKHIVNTLKAAFGRMRPEDRMELEKDEPLSYRGSWVMLCIGFIWLLGLLLFTGFHFEQAFALIFLSVILWIGQTRILGLVGIHLENTGAVQWIPRVLWYPELPYPGDPPTDLVVGAVLWSCPSNRHPTADGWGWSMWAPFQSYKMASLTGIHPRNVFKVLIVSLLVAQFMGLVSWSAIISSYGYARFGGTAYWDCNMEWWSTIHWFIVSPGHPSTWIGHIILGLFIVATMTYLHARLLWFPHPLGPILAWTWAGLLQAWWSAFFVAWVLKLLTLRIGGSRVYEEVAVPFVGGLVAGYTVMSFIFGALGVTRFFIPF